jgi:hypothetical protein
MYGMVSSTTPSVLCSPHRAEVFALRLTDEATANLGAGEELQDHTTCPPPRGEWAK